jgi:serpin B
MSSFERGRRYRRPFSPRFQGTVRRLTLEEMERRWFLSAAPLTSPPALTASATSGTSANLAAEEASVSQSVDGFALDLYAQLQSTTGGNLFASPFSIATALAMTYAGAGGDTAQQMASVLHLGSDPSSVEGDFGALLNDLNSAGQSGGYVLSVANALWAQQGLDILPEFLNVIQSDFGGGLNQADFLDDAEAARQTINDWVAQQTQGKITDLFPPDTITDMTRLVLANAMYFKGNWASPFDPNLTSDAPFTLASGSQVTASTMHQTADFRYMERDGFQVLELPYANGRLAMDILLPTQSGLSALGSNQIPADITSWLGGLRTANVQVSLPKFTMTTQFNMIPPLKALGMTDAFAPGIADFSGITDSLRLYINAVVHKAFISVDETGTEATAATGVGASTSCVLFDPNPPVVFNADHPFLYLIRDTQSGAVLFMGQVENPLQQTSDPWAPVITQQPRSQEPVTPTPVPPPPVISPPILADPPVSTPINLPRLSAPIASSPPSASTPPLMGPFYSAPTTTAALSPNEELVDAFYQTLLGRTAEPTALAYWSKQLDGGASRASVVSDLEATTEYRQDEVESLYEEYLGRAADPAGLDYFAGQLASGATVEQIAATLAGSPEFLQAHGDAGNLVDALFSTILGRSADTAGSAYFSQQLAAGETTSQVAAQLLASDEYQQQLAGTLLTKFLDRPADTGGVDHFAAELHAGVTDQQVVGDILSSDEFYARATAG